MCAALTCSCARIVSPSGGPEDTAPPALTSVDPASGPGLPDLRRIVLRWSERIEESTAEISLYPRLPGEISISGGTIRIDLEDPLGDGVLVLHIPGTLSDLHGNATGAPVDLAWSGTDSLPSGRIEMDFVRQGGGVPAEHVLADISTPDGLLIRRTSADTSFHATAGWLPPGS